MKIALKKISLIITISLSTLLFSQKRTEEFTITVSNQKIEKSYYKSISIIDKRIDTTSIGIVQQGGLNAKARVVATSSLASQFQNILDNINGENAEMAI